jgi:LDH2 family malate/lactate/ureidoglycolate dehydrogenase
MRVPLEDFKYLTHEAVLSYGYSEPEAEQICDVLMYAQLRGNSQGVVKLIGPGIPRHPEEGEIRSIRESTVSALIDGANNHAMIVVNHAVDVAIEKAASNGVGIVGVQGIGTSSGALGYYARRIAEREMIGIVLSGAPPTVAPEGSYEAVFGTNPLAISIPAQGRSVTLDMATGAIALYGVIEAQTAGRQLPSDTAYDSEGAPTVDPTAALEGALRTFDRGPKSSGLSFMIQALAGPLVGAAFAGIGDVKDNWGGHLMIAIDPALLGGRDQMMTGVTAMVERVKEASRLDGVDEIFVPGERGDRQAEEVARSGEIEIESKLFEELRQLCREGSPAG